MLPSRRGLDELDSDAPDLTAAIEALSARASRMGARPAVFVIDSLIANYGIGPNAPRRHVDGVMKFAASQGVALVLCQETVDEQASPWDFSADSVISLGQAEDGERRLTVRKHRFGGSAQGAHRFTINGRSQPRIVPRMDAWLKPGFFETLRLLGWIRYAGARQPEVIWPTSFGWTEKLSTHRLGSSLTLVTGSLAMARQFAGAMLEAEIESKKRTDDLVILLDPLAMRAGGWFSKSLHVHLVPTFNGPAALILAFARLVNADFFAKPPRRILIGDIALAPDGQEIAWANAVRILAGLIGSIGLSIPVIVFATKQGNAVSAIENALIKIADARIALHTIGTDVLGTLTSIKGESRGFSFPQALLEKRLFADSPSSKNRFAD
jgi:hypothetical protein